MELYCVVGVLPSSAVVGVATSEEEEERAELGSSDGARTDDDSSATEVEGDSAGSRPVSRPGRTRPRKGESSNTVLLCIDIYELNSDEFIK